MVQGVEIDPREREFIIRNKETKFPSQIAKELSERFEPINHGYRSVDTVRKVINNKI